MFSEKKENGDKGWNCQKPIIIEGGFGKWDESTVQGSGEVIRVVKVSIFE